MALTIPRKRVLVCAYACEPGQGSEPGVGWSIVCGLAHYHDLLVVTRANNREKIEAAVLPHGVNIRFVYFDLPRWVQWCKHAPLGIYWYYYLWQVSAGRWLVRDILPGYPIDVSHHASFQMAWMPSCVSAATRPYVFGPVGGGERVPKTQLLNLSYRVRVAECGRVIAQNILIRLPAVKNTLKHASVTLSTSTETATWLKALGYANVETFPPGWLSRGDFPREPMSSPNRDCFVFMSVGRLVPWKGFALGLRAFALALPRLNRAEYWVAGSGPQRHELEQLVSVLGIGDIVKWLGSCPREMTLSYLESCDVLVHPSMRDSASWACVEALALGKPIIGLRAGGAIHQVTPDCGYLLEGRDVVPEMAEAMVTLALRRDEYESKAQAARAKFCTVLCAEENIPRLAQRLAQVAVGDCL